MGESLKRSGVPRVVHYDEATIELARAEAVRLQSLAATNNVIEEILWDAARGAGGGDRQTDTEWSRPMSKKEMARLLGCPHAKKAEWLNQCVKAGLYCVRKCTRQTFQVDLATVPRESRDKFRTGN